MATPGTLFGYTESEVAGLAIGFGLVAVVLFKLGFVRHLIRQHRVGRTGAYLLYGVFALGVLSILVIVLLLFFWKV